MEPAEIGVVLARASELHSKISDAIERALKSEFLLSTGGRSQNNGDSENPSTSPTFEAHGRRGGRYGNADGNGRGSVAGDGSAEARSLGAIRDALEVLEDQLESLQTFQQQQRTEKDSVLAEVEESRRLLLRMLKDHRGKEWEVVHEALAFAGEPVEDRDDLPLPPYPMPRSDPSGMEDESIPYHVSTNVRYNGALRKLSSSVGQRDGVRNLNYLGGADGSDEENQEEGTSFRVENVSKEGGGLLGFARAVFAHAYGLTSKAALVVASVAAAMAVAEMRQRMERKRACSKFASKRPTSPPPIAVPSQLPLLRECPPGKKLIIEDGYSMCVVKERVELPFPKEIRTPDVLYGRG